MLYVKKSEKPDKEKGSLLIKDLDETHVTGTALEYLFCDNQSDAFDSVV